MKKILVLALVIVSVFALTVPAMAATRDVGTLAVTLNQGIGPVAPCLYSRMTQSSAYLVKNLSGVTGIHVWLDCTNIKWARGEYSTTANTWRGYILCDYLNISKAGWITGLFHTSMLKSGDSGTAVRNLQYALSNLGYGPGGTPNGSFGTSTVNAVKEFQRDYGLSTVDGIVGNETKTKIVELLRSKGVISY